jgi:hypothetical protein
VFICHNRTFEFILTPTLAKNPVPIRCPVAGKYNFSQKGDVPFETRILGGVTQSPRPGVYCKTNISDFSVCDKEQKEVRVDENYCLSVDYVGRPVDIYSKSFNITFSVLVGLFLEDFLCFVLS